MIFILVIGIILSAIILFFWGKQWMQFQEFLTRGKVRLLMEKEVILDIIYGFDLVDNEQNKLIFEEFSNEYNATILKMEKLDTGIKIKVKLYDFENFEGFSSEIYTLTSVELEDLSERKMKL